MESLIAVAGLLFAAAITPGPSNTIVLAAAARSGLSGAVPSIAGVLAGSLALLALVWTGADALFAAVPALRHLLLAAGALYLIWLGGNLIWRSGDTGEPPRQIPSTTLGIAAFQILNPKSWVMVTTASVAMAGSTAGMDGLSGFGRLAALMLLIPGICLTIWALAGVAIAVWLRRRKVRRCFDRAMGCLLILSAFLLVAGRAMD